MFDFLCSFSGIALVIKSIISGSTFSSFIISNDNQGFALKLIRYFFVSAHMLKHEKENALDTIILNLVLNQFRAKL